MLSNTWLAKRKPHWVRLEELLDAAGRDGLRRLTRDDLRDLGLLYRQLAADLAAIREDPSSAPFAHYLNQVLARAHNTIYSAERGRGLALARFVRRTYPAVVRRNLAACLTAVAVFVLAALAGSAITLRDPEFKLKILGPQMVETIERQEMWTHSIVTMKPVASSAIMTNNMNVAFTMFALGMTAGIGTLYMLALNGLLMGVVATACAVNGMSVPLWSFVAPHGALELPAIFIAGGAGLRLAQGILFPGCLPRREAVSRAGTDAVQMLLGCIPLLVVAGLVEGFVSPTGLAVPLKFTTGASLFALLAAYLFSGRAGGSGEGPGGPARVTAGSAP